MPFYLDRHDLRDMSADDVAIDHRKDVELEGGYGVKYLTYWFDYDRQHTFCLVDAPDEDTAVEVHRQGHGSLPSVITPVDPSDVASYLGRVFDPDGVDVDPIAEPAFRTMLFTDIVSSTELGHEVGDAEAMQLLRIHDRLIRTALEDNNGREVRRTGDGFLASFVSATNVSAPTRSL